MTQAENDELRRDIERRGLQVPLEVTPRRVVLDGRGRLRAALELGLPSVPVRVVGPPDEPEYMLLAALTRRQLTPSQRAALALELANLEQLRAAGRQRQHRNLRQNRSERATLPARGRTRDRIAELAGASPRTAQDAITVYEHDPELFQRVKAGKLAANQAARMVQRRIRDAALPAAPPLPEGPFELVYADPPWQLGNPDGPWAPENHYPTMPLEEIAALQIPAAANAVLFLWAVNCRLREALQVMEAWGFRYLTNLAWVKPSIGPGRRVRNRHELLLYGQKGTLPAPDPEDLSNSAIEAPRGRHSEKPPIFRQLIERMYPTATKVELFARGQGPPGWAVWGNQAEEPNPPDERR
jgi:N6-adenosine-specific RNA methylase IME4